MHLGLLYLDFDGVLHPGPTSSTMVAKTHSRSHYEEHLFRSADVLVEILHPYAAELRIVLSTSWVLNYGLERARKLLPDQLAQRVIGATFDERTTDRHQFGELSRYEQIFRDITKRRASRWLALDDDKVGWPQSQLSRLVAPPSGLGLQCEETQAQLQRALAINFGVPGRAV